MCAEGWSGFAAAVRAQTYYSGRANRVINSWVAEGAAWVLEGEGEPAVRLKGATLDLHLNWLDRLAFADGDAYAWDKARAKTTTLHACCVAQQAPPAGKLNWL
jgi:hypothetical protein